MLKDAASSSLRCTCRNSIPNENDDLENFSGFPPRKVEASRNKKIFRDYKV
ncbi:hypothetical protein OROHE_003795 [Orobanche hederae]